MDTPTLLLRLVDDASERVILETQLYVDVVTPDFIAEDLLVYFQGRTRWNLQAVQDWVLDFQAAPPRLIVHVQAVVGG